MRAWVLENGLLDHTGHHFNNSMELRDACVRRGIETRFLVHRDALPAVVSALDATPVFDYGPYDLASDDPLAGPLENLIMQGNAFAHSLAGLGAALDPDDLVLVPSALQNELYGCALYLAQLAPERRPRLALTFIVENFFARGTRRWGLTATFYRFAARQLARVCPPQRLLLAANGKEMADALAQVLALPVSVLPIPKVYLPEALMQLREPGPLRVAILGHSRPEKGFGLVPELIEHNPGLRFLIQVAPAGATSQWKNSVNTVRSASNAEVIEGALDAAAYHALMARADIVLLPYDATLTPLRSSGVFAEAVGAAIVTVVPAGTWMAGHLAEGRGAGVTFDGFGAAAVSAALRDAAARLPELKLRAHACAPAWRAEQSAAAYLERILRAFGPTQG